jgi:hypothetical protein
VAHKWRQILPANGWRGLMIQLWNHSSCTSHAASVTQPLLLLLYLLLLPPLLLPACRWLLS